MRRRWVERRGGASCDCKVSLSVDLVNSTLHLHVLVLIVHLRYDLHFTELLIFAWIPALAPDCRPGTAGTDPLSAVQGVHVPVHGVPGGILLLIYCETMNRKVPVFLVPSKSSAIVVVVSWYWMSACFKVSTTRFILTSSSNEHFTQHVQLFRTIWFFNSFYSNPSSIQDGGRRFRCPFCHASTPGEFFFLNTCWFWPISGYPSTVLRIW